MMINGDCLEVLKSLSETVHCCVTSPPYYGLRDYLMAGQIGLEETPEAFVERLVEVFREVKRLLRDDGTLWLNLGDSYWSKPNGNIGATRKNRARHAILKHKDLVGIPWRVAFALQADGWYLRQDIIWHKPNPMPESVTDRCTKAHEYIFLFSKSKRYYYDHEAIREPTAYGLTSLNKTNGNGGPRSHRGSRFDTGKSGGHQLNRAQKGVRFCGNLLGRGDGGNACNMSGQEMRNKRSVWTVSSKPFKGAHFAVFPPDLIEPCILAGCPKGGTVLDPFGGAGTTGVVAKQHEREYVGIELNPEYVAMSEKRIASTICQSGLW